MPPRCCTSVSARGNLLIEIAPCSRRTPLISQHNQIFYSFGGRTVLSGIEQAIPFTYPSFVYQGA